LEEIMRRHRVLTVVLLVLGFSLASAAREIPGQTSQATQTVIGKIDQYLTAGRNAEIQLARSAAPQSISRDAEVWILQSTGYAVAVKGTNGFVCLVDRSWMLPLDNPEFWNPSVRLPSCLNAPAARSHLPLTFKTTALALAGRSRTQIADSIKTAFATHALPLPELGSICYMMSKQQYFGPKVGNADPHLMFWFSQKAHLSWGAEFTDTPVDVHQYSPQPITEFAISVSKWSDGSPVSEH
jgi:hypothetical protein